MALASRHPDSRRSGAPAGASASARAALLAAMAAVALAACGQDGPGSELPPDASIEELARAFAPCDDPPDLVASAVDFVAGTAGWLHVTGVVEAAREDGPERAPARVSAAADSTVPAAPGEVEVLAHRSYWPGVEWALTNDADVWFALADPEAVGADNRVSFVLVILPDGRVFLPGVCQHDVLYQPLARAFRDGLDATMRDAAGRVGDDLYAVLLAGQVQQG